MKKIILLLCFVLTACDPIASKDPSNVTNTKPVNVAIDEEKLISQGIEAPEDPRTLNDPTYSILPTSRLLIRFGALLSDAGNILDEQPILLRIEVSDADLSIANKSLQVCPLLKNWMMFATWNRAHAYKHGAWDHPGGDIDFSGCMQVLASTDPAFTNKEEKDFCSAKDAVCFNILPYFKDFVKTRGIDNGISVLVQDNVSVNIYGKSTTKGPILFWRKLRY